MENTNEETVTISKKEYNELIADQEFLRALRQAGVDNWEGYPMAHDIMDGDWEALGISPAMKEDLNRDNEDTGSSEVSGSMKEDLKRESDAEDRGCFPGFGDDDW